MLLLLLLVVFSRRVSVPPLAGTTSDTSSSNYCNFIIDMCCIYEYRAPSKSGHLPRRTNLNGIRHSLG